MYSFLSVVNGLPHPSPLTLTGTRAYERGVQQEHCSGPDSYGGPETEGTFECFLITNSKKYSEINAGDKTGLD